MTTVNSTSTLHGLSNSVRNHQNLSFPASNVTNISIDRLSFTGIMGDQAAHSFRHSIRNRQGDIIYAIDEHKAMTSLLKGQAYNKALYFSYDKYDKPSIDSNMRLDFNPNNMPDEIYHDYITTFLNNITNISVTRLDIAIDIEMDLSSYRFHLARMQQGNNIFAGDFIDQTKYLGSPNSARHIIIYNKKLELSKRGIEIEQEHLWRFEVVLRDSWVNNWQCCLDGVMLVEHNKTSHLDFTGLSDNDRRTIIALIHEPSEWAKLKSDNSVRKYRKLIDSLSVRVTPLPNMRQSLIYAHDKVIDGIERWTYLKEDDLLNQNTNSKTVRFR